MCGEVPRKGEKSLPGTFLRFKHIEKWGKSKIRGGEKYLGRKMWSVRYFGHFKHREK